MHYHAEVWVPKNENVRDQVKTILAPYEENDSGDGWWDWWVIGGRRKGIHVPTYDPENDPAHQEVCDLCGGTGNRPGWAWIDADGVRQFGDDWARECNGCNGCKGTGQRISWPTQGKPSEQDVISVTDVPDRLTCFTVVLSHTVIHSREWDGSSFVDGGMGKKTVKEILVENGIETGYLVTVDYHC